MEQSEITYTAQLWANDLDDGVIRKSLKFADDVKLIGQVSLVRLHPNEMLIV